MKPILAVVLLLGLLGLNSTSVWADDKPPAATDKDAAGFQRFLDDVVAASKAKPDEKAPEWFDAQEFMTLVMGPEFNQLAAQPQTLAAMRALQKQLNLVPLTEAKLLKSKRLQDPDRAELTVRTVDEDGVASRTRYWVYRKGDRWIAFDCFDQMLGLTISKTTRAAMIEVAADPELVRDRGAIAGLMAAGQLMMAGDFERMKAIIERIKNARLPKVFMAMRNLFQAVVLVSEEMHADAIPILLEADRLENELTLVHRFLCECYLLTKEYESAVKSGEYYLSVADEDADVSILIGQAYQALGKVKDARDAWLTGLDHSPNHEELWQNLLEIGIDDQAVLVTRLKRADSPDELIGTLVSYLRNLDEPKWLQIETLLSAFEVAFPKSTKMFALRGEILFDKEDFTAAADQNLKAYRLAVANKDTDEAEESLSRFCECHLRLKSLWDAYSNFDDKRLFLKVIWKNRDIRHDPAPIHRILDDHAQRFPDDLYVPLFRGQLFYNADRLNEADREFAKVVPDRKPRDIQVLDCEDPQQREALELRIFIAMESSQTAEGFQRLPFPQFCFDEMARRLYYERPFKKSQLSALISAYEAEAIPQSADRLSYWRLLLRFADYDYSGVIDWVKSNPPLTTDEFEVPGAALPSVPEVLLRAHLRLGQLENVKKIIADNEDPLPFDLRWAGLAAASKAQQFRAAYEESLGDERIPFPIYDTDLDSHLARDVFSSVISVDSPDEAPVLTVLVESSIQHELSRIIDSINSKLVVDATKSVTFQSRLLHDFSIDTFVNLDIEKSDVQFRFHDSSFFSKPVLNGIEDGALRKRVTESKGWLRISMDQTEALTTETRRVLLVGALAATADSKPVAVFWAQGRQLVALPAKPWREWADSQWQAVLNPQSKPLPKPE